MHSIDIVNRIPFCVDARSNENVLGNMLSVSNCTLSVLVLMYFVRRLEAGRPVRGCLRPQSDGNTTAQVNTVEAASPQPGMVYLLALKSHFYCPKLLFFNDKEL